MLFSVVDVYFDANKNYVISTENFEHFFLIFMHLLPIVRNMFILFVMYVCIFNIA